MSDYARKTSAYLAPADWRAVVAAAREGLAARRAACVAREGREVIGSADAAALADAATAVRRLADQVPEEQRK